MMRIPLIDRIAAEEGIAPELAHAIYYNEADRKKGLATTWGDGGKAYGPFQLHADAADEVGVDRFSVEGNVRGGIRYYKRQLDKYGDPLKAAAAYNRGPGMADRIISGKAPPDQVNAANGYVSRFIDFGNKLFGIRQAAAADDVPMPPAEAQPDVERMFQALRAADKAGAADDARRIAEMIRRAQSGPESGPQERRPEPAATRAPEEPKYAPAAQKTAQAPRPLFSGATGSWDEPSFAESVGVGLQDPIAGASQLITHAIPESAVRTVNDTTAAIDDTVVGRALSGVLGETPRMLASGEIDRNLQEREAAYQSRRGPNAGIDWGRATGNSIATLPVAAAMPGGPVVSSMLAGGTTGAVMPTSGGADSFFQDKAAQVGAGMLGGALGGAVTSGASRVLAPPAAVNPNVQALLAEGITPTPGQLAGGIGSTIEQRAMSLPIAGGIIENARRAPVEQLNRAVLNRALAPIGERSTAPLGRDAIDEVAKKLGSAYDDLLPGLVFKADDGVIGKIADLRAMAAELPPPQASRFNQVVDDIVMKRLDTQTRAADGITYKGIQSKLGELAKGYKSSQDVDQRQLGYALTEVQRALKDGLYRSNPSAAAKLNAIDSGYADYAIARRAAGMVGSDEGLFSPAQLQSAVRAKDATVEKGAFARGKARMQDLSDPAKAVLGNNVPDSGTAGRALQANLMGLGLGAVSAVPLAAVYSPAGQRAAALLMAQRPGSLLAAGRAVRAGGAALPYMAPSGIAEILRQYGLSGQ